MAERVGFYTPPFPKSFRVRDMPKNAAFTGIFVVSHLSHPSQKYLLLTTVSRYTVWMVWKRLCRGNAQCPHSNGMAIIVFHLSTHPSIYTPPPTSSADFARERQVIRSHTLVRLPALMFCNPRMSPSGPRTGIATWGRHYIFV